MVTLEQSGKEVRISGDLNVDGACTLFGSPPSFTTDRVTIDLSAVKELDSAGLSLLVHWHQLAADSGGSLKVEGAGEQATNLIRISALDSILL